MVGAGQGTGAGAGPVWPRAPRCLATRGRRDAGGEGEVGEGGQARYAGSRSRSRSVAVQYSRHQAGVCTAVTSEPCSRSEIASPLRPLSSQSPLQPYKLQWTSTSRRALPASRPRATRKGKLARFADRAHSHYL
ncbi:unnamed protein product [Parnassius apollo]|uniref:(apollo) hypothetical protein n=1 Tax=Parnassius apollo TaxID=110799 RepID=A0A8S3XE28_PARAO|nr:unnamed protein product [Parnassius apollo]